MPSHFLDSEASHSAVEEDQLEAGMRYSSHRRSSRVACDQCRKTKSRCIKVSLDAVRCKDCTSAATVCTYNDVTYKRGPPKGYIHAIEQRWQQVESVLGAILACADVRAQGVIADLRKDELAGEILDRVNGGPYGPAGRIQQPSVATKEDFFLSILNSVDIGPTSTATDSSPQPRRQSRLSRELVSAGHSFSHLKLAAPTTKWQDDLINLLNTSSQKRFTLDTSMRTQCAPTSSPPFDAAGAPLLQQRRLDNPLPASTSEFEGSSMYTFDAQPGDSPWVETSSASGQLSVDENKEVRFHGKASGLHFLPRGGRTDEHNQGGIWRFPMARVWPRAVEQAPYLKKEEVLLVDMPPVPLQDHLVDLYFRYVHPHFPVLHKADFMSEYLKSNFTSVQGANSAVEGAPPQQSAPNLVLLCMFAISAQFFNEPAAHVQPEKLWEAGYNHLNHARYILSQTYYHSNVSTCQALLILGYQEFGIGSTEQGWLFVGLAIRMASDLGLNRNSDGWTSDGVESFSREGKQTRKQIWWVCCYLDKFASICMGRPIMIHEDDHDAPLPMVNEEDQESILPASTQGLPDYPATPGLIYSTFNAACSLSNIFGAIMTSIYPVRYRDTAAAPSLWKALESRLDLWYINLAKNLQYDSNTQQHTPPPHILMLHIQYWTAVSLLHRAFIPCRQDMGTATHEVDSEALKAFDLAHIAANRISTTVTVYRRTFGLRYCPPSLGMYLLSAGITHTIGLTNRSPDPQMTLGMQQCLDALKDMEVVWPSAAGAWTLLHGNMQHLQKEWHAAVRESQAKKRVAEEAFDGLPNGETTTLGDNTTYAGSYQDIGGVQDTGSAIMANMLGLGIPEYRPTNRYHNPGYDIWATIAESEAQQRQAHQLESLVQGLSEFDSRNCAGEPGTVVPDQLESKQQVDWIAWYDRGE